MSYSSADELLQILLHLVYLPDILVYMAWHILDLFAYYGS